MLRNMTESNYFIQSILRGGTYILKSAKKELIPDREVERGAPREGGAPKIFP